MRRLPWDILFTLLAGFGLGLAYSWLLSPLNVTDSTPAALRADFMDFYRSAVAASYAATGNLPRAEARLSLLQDASTVEALNSQAQRMIASGEFTQADQLAALAMAILNHEVLAVAPTAATGNQIEFTAAPAATVSPPPGDLPFLTTETPEAAEPPRVDETPGIETQPVIVNTPTRRPTQTPVPTLGVPFALIAQDTVCDTNLPEGLLQVFVFNSSRRQVAGASILISWENNQEQFFTGLKPEVGNGYADFVMSPTITYSLRLALGSDIAEGLVAPTCQTSSGETYLGGIKLTFQQP